MEFGERNRDCALGHGGNEGRHLRMTGESRGFFSIGIPSVGFLTRYDAKLNEPLVEHQGVGLHASGEGERVIALESW